MVLAALGGGLGLLLAWAAIRGGGDPTGGFLPIFYIRGRDFVLGAGMVLALGIAAGILPGMQALRLRIVDALRRV
jgi:putative ABC transport system permease protein